MKYQVVTNQPNLDVEWAFGPETLYETEAAARDALEAAAHEFCLWPEAEGLTVPEYLSWFDIIEVPEAEYLSSFDAVEQQDE
jgi:hypothetical protein